MRKIILVMMMWLIWTSSAGAATIESAYYHDNKNWIYPIVHVANAEAERKISYKIQENMDGFVKGLTYDAQYHKRNVLESSMNYEVACNETGGTVILSIIATNSRYYEGAAHPMSYKRAWNFNTSTGNRIGINYLTDVGEGVPVQQIIDRLSAKLKEKAAREGIKLFDDALPLKKLPDDFYWDENLHVHFIFQQYEIVPYVYGFIDVDID